jgi:hypothetical protein
MTVHFDMPPNYTVGADVKSAVTKHQAMKM